MDDDDKLDANLVLALDALLRERSVSKAAERVGIKQPAMSHALKRLRERFDDPLLVRGDGRRMQLTPRALELADLARQGAEAVARVFEAPTAFDPATSTRRFRIAATDGMDAILLPRLLAHLAHAAPHVDLDMPAAGPELEVALEEARIDLAIVRWDDAPLGLRRRTLYREQLVCVVRTNHPRVGDTIDLATFAALAHVLVAPRGSRRGVIDDVLAEHRVQRRIALALPSFVAAIIAVAESDLVLTVPRRLAESLRGRLPLRIVPTPVDVPACEVQQIWHERDHHDPAHRWLRSAIASLLDDA